MTHILLITFWAAAITGWGTALYAYTCGLNQKKPNINIIIRLLIAGIVSLMLGTLCYSFIQATIMHYVRLGV